MNDQFDVVILGGGAAGLSAGTFAGRRGLKTLIITKEVGGQTASTLEIENYPGVGRIEGPVLMAIMKEQAIQFGCQLIYGDIGVISKSSDGFAVSVGEQQYVGTTLIAACGKRPRLLGLSDENKWLGKGIFYSSTDIPDGYANGKVVAVVGGGSAALEEAILHSRTAKKVYIIHRRGSFRAEDILVQQVKEISNIECIFHAESTAIGGDDSIESITYVQDSNSHTLSLDMICVKIGYDSDATLFQSLVQLDNQGRIPIDRNAHTTIEGLFAAGDITNVDFQQIVISSGDGAKAALSAFFYLMEKKGIKGTKADWGYLV
ncbi:MAG: FAD-dependent oxidoreductase [Patescibacteria group bacterium]